MAVYSTVIPTRLGHYVYRLWAADGTCLYVGLTGERGLRRVSTRLRAHQGLGGPAKPWWPEVARIEVAALSTAVAAIAEEEAQIIELKPVHNMNGLGLCPRGHRRSVARIDGSGRCRQCELEQNRAKRGPLGRRRWQQTGQGLF